MKQGRAAEAFDLLESLLKRVTEGFDMTDVREAVSIRLAIDEYVARS